jgi:hypothetical protein
MTLPKTTKFGEPKSYYTTLYHIILQAMDGCTDQYNQTK